MCLNYHHVCVHGVARCSQPKTQLSPQVGEEMAYSGDKYECPGTIDLDLHRYHVEIR